VIAERPHPVGSADHARVRDYIVSELTRLGLQPIIQTTTGIGTRYQEAGRVQNIAARLRGTDPNGKAVLVMAHYDGVEAGPAAADDGAGCAALLETLRATRAAKHPLRHDVIALFTDGEESGLLGSAAFVREHPWAKDVAVVLNFEARGTTGRSFMFETGPGNLDAARALRNAPGVTAGSVYATIYRMLPNDTDLSEFSVLGLPALNFAFADGVERYHTSRDDVSHLDHGSLQHHGSQMLAMARTFASGPLPRPITGDGVFFDLPVLGLVVYPQGLELPLTILALVLVGAVVFRERTGVALGTLIAVAALISAALIGWVMSLGIHGAAVWSGFSALSITLLGVAVTLAWSSVALRWAGSRALHSGALIVWTVLALLLALRAPGVSYLFVWPVLFAAVARLVSRGQRTFEWLAAGVTLFLIAGFIYGVSVVMLGIAGAGAIALAIVTALVVLLLAPLVDLAVTTSRWQTVTVLGVGLLSYAIALVFVRADTDHPIRSAIAYAENADSSDAWLGVSGSARDAWTRTVIGSENRASVPAWTSWMSPYAARFSGRRVLRVPLDSPSVVMLRDSVTTGSRNIVLRLRAPVGSTALFVRARGAKVMSASIDGRVADTSRYRYPERDWVMQYWAVPDSGAIIGLSIPAASHINFDVASRRPGIPQAIAVTLPPRPSFVAPSQTGDISVSYKSWRF
jgi:peptidase M28-like protein